jgi:hypothetical protein
MKTRLTFRSANKKTGPIPVTTSDADTCPDACPLKAGGCYAKSGPLAIVWKDVEKYGYEWQPFLQEIRKFLPSQLWRHNQAGDLPGEGDSVNPAMLAELTAANLGRRGFTYTHKPVLAENGGSFMANRRAIAKANKGGFRVNLSGNNLAHADRLSALNIGPVVSIVPQDTPAKFTTPEGRKGVICPAQLKEGISCSTCGICQRPREVIVGFRPHGTSKKKAETIAAN